VKAISKPDCSVRDRKVSTVDPLIFLQDDNAIFRQVVAYGFEEAPVDSAIRIVRAYVAFVLIDENEADC
jgi:hypothetical protein